MKKNSCYVKYFYYFCSKIQKKIKMKNIAYSTNEINKNFRIKVFGINEGKKINTLVGVSGAIELIGERMFNTLLERAFSSTEDVCVCKLRRGLKFSFYCK